MKALETLLPVILLILLGYGLARIRFVNQEAVGHLTRLVFWIGLPALIIRSIAEVRVTPDQVLGPVGIGLGSTVAILLLALLVARLRGSPPPVMGSMAQSAFRGNLAFVGLPIIAYSLGDLPPAAQKEAFGLAMVIVAPMMMFYNILAILVLLGCQHRIGLSGARLIGRSLVTNPLILACALGLGLSWQEVGIPLFLDRFLRSLGDISVPLALIGIGASFTSLQIRGRRTALWIAVALKIIGTPLLVWGLCMWAGYHGVETRILLLFAACPTAAAAYIMAHQMGGDAELSATTIALSSLLCVIPLSLILLWF